MICQIIAAPIAPTDSNAGSSPIRKNTELQQIMNKRYKIPANHNRFRFILRNSNFKSFNPIQSIVQH